MKKRKNRKRQIADGSEFITDISLTESESGKHRRTEVLKNFRILGCFGVYMVAPQYLNTNT